MCVRTHGLSSGVCLSVLVRCFWALALQIFSIASDSITNISARNKRRTELYARGRLVAMLHLVTMPAREIVACAIPTSGAVLCHVCL
jgi:hypothetical protein